MRLTEWRGEHAAIANHRENYIDKLAAYEDTGYSPLEIKSLEGEWNAMRKVVDSYRKAEEQGRLVRLPCKVGDAVYYLNPFDEIESGKITMIQQKADGTWKFRVTTDFSHDVTTDAIGKTVFLTREAAEAALNGGQDDV